jgi:phospholipid/cholesterol/gamma-HCH transport system substrate-binding protein
MILRGAIRNSKVAMIATAVLLVATLLGGTGIILRSTFFRPMRISVYFSAANAIYVGDNVRVAGIKVGSITAIEPDGNQARMSLEVDHGVPIPADAKAIIVAQNLVAARYVQLTPTYQPGDGPTLKDGAVIPIERTAVPVEWDEVKNELMRLATDLGPNGRSAATATGRFINSAANAMADNGDKLRQTLAQLSGVSRILADNGGNLVDILKNLQTFVTALRDSNVQIVQFSDRLATLTSVIEESRSDLAAGVTDLSAAIGDVQRFVASTGNQTAEQIQRLANVTQTLVEHRDALENILHLAPTAVANAYNAYDPDTGTLPGTFVFSNFSNPVEALCSAIGGIANVTAPETAKLCALYLGPGLRLLNFNSLAVPMNPFLTKSADPGTLIYSEPSLAAGGSGPPPDPPEIPPAMSAYPPAAGSWSGPPGTGSPSGPSTLRDMLVPKEIPQPQPAGPPADGTPPR